MFKVIKKEVKPEVVNDGAGVRLKRLIGGRLLPDVDPFLLLDHFGSDDPDDYIAGFPMHPHRGIETVTYMLDGNIRHRDSVGNEGVISKGGVQWMTAGSGIMHEEMPQLIGGRLNGFQLWLNLSRVEKMTEPSYQEFDQDEIPVFEDSTKTVKVICGEFGGVAGVVEGTSVKPTYLDVSLSSGGELAVDTKTGVSSFLYVFEGSIRNGESEQSYSETLIQFEEEGNSIKILAGSSGARFIYASATPLREPLVRYGPFVMNTEDEIKQALLELQEGMFVKNG